MQDTIYCFHLLATRQKRTLLYALCSIPVVTAIWLLNPEWPFWAGYIAWALVCTAVLMIQYAAPLPIRCPHCGHAGFAPPRRRRRNREGRIQASCWNAGAAAPPFIRTPISHGRGKAFAAVSFPRMNGKKNLPVNKPGLLPPERKAGRTGFPEFNGGKD